MEEQMELFVGPVIKVKARRKINARCIRKYNKTDTGKLVPIMMIFPSDKVNKQFPTSARIQFNTGAMINVYSTIIKVDGGAEYMEIFGNPDMKKNPTGVKLYIPKLQVQKTA